MSNAQSETLQSVRFHLPFEVINSLTIQTIKIWKQTLICLLWKKKHIIYTPSVFHFFLLVSTQITLKQHINYGKTHHTCTHLSALWVLLVIKKPGRIVTTFVSLGHMLDSLVCRNSKYFFFLSLFLQTTKPVVPAHSRLTSLDQFDSYTLILTVCFPCRLYENNKSSSLMFSWFVADEAWKCDILLRF